MPLIVETGSIVADANTYADEATLTLLAAECGVTLVAADIEQHAIKATRFLESYRSRYQGTKTDSGQSLQWPRTGVCIDGTDIGSDVIPSLLVEAQVALMVEQHNGNDLFSNATRPASSTIAGGALTENTVELGPLRETLKYSSSATAAAVSNRVGGLLGSVSMFEAAINPLLKLGGGLGLTAVRA